MIPNIPTATYRLQFNKSFTFRQARELIPYLHALGISHIYASPYFRAMPGSMHGYDICDHNQLNPEIGTREDYDEFVAELHRHGMRQIVDFVPNHMGIGTPLNVWWMDVLENGPASVFATHFDIDWHPVKNDLENKVLLPILGDQYGRVLERAELKLEFKDGAFFLRYFENTLPLAPRSYIFLLKPSLEELVAGGVEENFVVELQSILTSLDHLPLHTESDPEKIAERAREKEVIKRRIARLCEECPPALEAIEHSMRRMEGTAGDPRSFDEFDQLLNAQAYRLSYWRVASEEINYRRFFDINTLAAIRMEAADVFEATHRLVFELIASGAIDGLRIDHVDGLWNPREYLEKLQSRSAEVLGTPPGSNPLYLLVEKILLGSERLRPDWPVHGTTGYDFVNEVTGLFVDPNAEKSFSETYQKFIGATQRFNDIAYLGKQLVMRLAMASELSVLGHMLDRLSEKNRWYRDFTLNALTDALREIIACFPVYRAYVAHGEEPSEADREAVLRAVRQAKRRNPGIDRSVFNFIGEILLMKFPENIDEAARDEHVRFVMKLQQCAGPVMAKGVEDTAFYIYLRLTALNEVGGEPQRFGFPVEAFFERCASRFREHPQAMLASTTHDTKRSEDNRARIAALSEFPAAWRKALRRWHGMNRRFRTAIEGEWAPDANEEYLFYQTLLGSRPPEPMMNEPRGAREAYVQRIQDYMIKAIKEAKINTSWVQPNEEWETAVRTFVSKVLHGGSNRFLKDFEETAAQVAQAGMIISLAQLVLKCTVPGVPDFYQGCELWDFSLVDPDNRRPVDYEARRRALESLGDKALDPAALFKERHDGRIKLHITRALLNFRREHAGLFQAGDFVPLKATGTFAECCVAFMRRQGEKSLLVVVPRLSSRIGFPPIGEAWRDTAVELPRDLLGKEWSEVLTGARFGAADSKIALSSLLEKLPVAVAW